MASGKDLRGYEHESSSDTDNPDSDDRRPRPYRNRFGSLTYKEILSLAEDIYTPATVFSELDVAGLTDEDSGEGQGGMIR